MPLVRRRALLKRSGNSYSCSGNCNLNYCASYCTGLDGCYNCSNKCTSNCLEDCADVCSSDCRPVICHNCAQADTCSPIRPNPCSPDQPLCKVDKCGCDCASDCPSKFQTDQIRPCLRLEP